MFTVLRIIFEIAYACHGPWVDFVEERKKDESIMEEEKNCSDFPQYLEIPVRNFVSPSDLTALAVPLQ